MKTLICFEFSGIVRNTFAALGHNAWSCDLLPSERPGNHLQCDFRDAIADPSWDFIGFHPDCRVMANSGVRWLDTIPGRRDELAEAAHLFNLCLRDPRPGYVENSIMHYHAKALIDRPQDQVIQPHHYGEPRFKATCLWLKGVPPLKPTNRLTVPRKGTVEYRQWSAVHFASPSPTRWKERSRTFPGVAKAMSEQWGGTV